MDINQILDSVYPLTDDLSLIDREFLMLKRDKLRQMIEKYRSSLLINMEPFKLSVDIDELIKKIRN